MKKLIVMALGVAFVVGAQAAAVNWKMTGTPAGNGKTIYAFLESDRAAITALLEADNTGNAFISGLGAYANGSATSVSRAADGALASSSLVAGNNYDVFFVVYTPGTDPSYRVSTASLTTTAYDESSPSTTYPEFASTSSNMSSTIKFSSQTVPEPTSGLLMLVGLGALALRRRKA